MASIETQYFDLPDFESIIDKQKLATMYFHAMVDRLLSMFEYENLPKTIPKKYFERFLMLNGNCCVVKVNEELYAMVGGLGGKPNAYYIPTIYTVANPYLNFSKNLEIDKDCILIYNDSQNIGLIDMLTMYSAMLAENIISLRMASVNCRASFLISGDSDNSKLEAQRFIDNIIKGQLTSVATDAFLEGIKTQPLQQTSSNTITDLIELQQYLKASFYNDVGLNANYNMKRESLNSEETQMNFDSLFPLIDNMLLERQEGVERVNNMFGTNITVDLSSSWKKEREEIIENSNKLENEEEQEEPEETEKNEEGEE